MTAGVFERKTINLRIGILFLLFSAAANTKTMPDPTGAPWGWDEGKKSVERVHESERGCAGDARARYSPLPSHQTSQWSRAAR